MSFAVGDCVRLKSGSPCMTVSRLWAEKTGDKTPWAHVTWHNSGTGCFSTGDFPVETLTPAKSPLG